MKKTILIVDNASLNRRMLSRALCDDYDIITADSGRRALEIIQREHEKISAVLLDIVMPEIDGFAVLNKIRANSRLTQMPIIMITASVDESARRRSLAMGANDFVMKPYNPEVIKHCLINNITLYETVTTVSPLDADRLTGLYNREAFFDKAQTLISAHEPGYYIFSFFDVNKFKVINDQYGTQKGDEVLRYLAGVFKAGFEPRGGICCRVAADDFAILYPAYFQGTPEIEEIRRLASSIDGIIAPISFCVGRYVVNDLSLTPSAMYDRAVLAAESVKGKYGSQIAYYDESMRESLIREQEIVTEMEYALSQGQFEAWFQPQYNHSTRALIGAEALVRWRHPQKGMVPPVTFIPIFERNGFVYELDKFIWEDVCRNICRWIDEGREPLPVSVNISRHDIFHSDIVQVITGLVNKYKLPPDMLRLEITESAFADSAKQIINVVEELIDFGFTIEIDDFGSGYSSLNTLKDVPAQIIKLDMKFLESSTNSQRSGNILESVVRMAKWLDMAVIAEGVETLEQADYLKSIGCNYLQGYLYAKPMPAADYEALCTESGKEEHLIALEAVANLDNNAFWDPRSMDTLIFNSYVGGACIIEYYNGHDDLLRVNDRYAETFGEGVTTEDIFFYRATDYMDENNHKLFLDNLRHAIDTGSESTCEIVAVGLYGIARPIYIRYTVRVIARAGERHLIYCTVSNTTAQREAERKERRLTAEMRLIMDNVGLGVTASYIKDGKPCFIFANNRYYEMLGYTEEQFAREVQNPNMCIAPEDSEKVMSVARQVIQSGKSATVEYHAVKRDGTTPWFRVALSKAEFLEIGAPVHLCILRDISEEKRSELRALRAAEQAQVIMNDLSSGITAVLLRDDKIEFLFSNDRFYEIHGYTREEYNTLSETNYALIYPEDRERAQRETMEAYLEKKPAQLEYRIVRPDGALRWVSVSLSSSRFTGIEENVQLCVFTDITDTKQSELEHKNTLKLMQALMQDMPGGFCRMSRSPSGEITPVYVNEGLCKLSGKTREELIGANACDIIPGFQADDADIVRETLTQITEKGEASSPRFRMARKDGGYVWVMIFGRATKDAFGNGFLNIYYTDATEQEKTEELQKTLINNLPYGSVLHEYDGKTLKVIHLNKRFKELVNRQATEDIMLSTMGSVHPDDRELVTRELEAAIRQKRDAFCDFRVLCGENNYRLFHVTGRIVPRGNGKYYIYSSYTPVVSTAMSYQQLLPLALSAIMSSTKFLSFAKDTDLRYICASKAFIAMLGLASENDVIGKTDYDLFDRQLADKYRREDEELLRTGVPLVDIVESIPSSDGEPHYSSTSKSLLHDANGELIGLYGLGRDITDIRATRSQLELLTDKLPVGIAIYSVPIGKPEELALTFFSDGYCRLFGYTRDEYKALSDKNPLCLVFDEDIPLLQKQLTASISTGVPMESLFRTHVKDGSFKWISFKATVGEKNDDSLTASAVLIDITMQRTTMERLRMTEEENKLSIFHSGCIIYRYSIADKSLTLLSGNRLGDPYPENVANVPDFPLTNKMISPGSVDDYREFFDSILRGKESCSVMFQHRFEGDWRWMEAKSSTVFSDSGNPVKAIISFLDITEQLEKETVYKKWQQSLREMDPASYMLLRCNITKRILFDSVEGSLLKMGLDVANLRMDALTKKYASQMVHEDESEAFKAFLNSDTLLAGYYRGKRSYKHEYREKQPDGTSRWLRLSIDLVEYPNSTDVEAYLMFEDINDEKQSELRAKALAETDPLTGLLNRNAFSAMVAETIKAEGPDAIHALLMLDLDGFKQINDVFGHGAGDQVLKDIASSLRSMVRRDDLVCRLGGDEFLVFLKNIPDDGIAERKAIQVNERARKAFSLEVQISGSVGIAIVPRDGTDFETLYKKVDSALYYVKNTGKNSYVFYRDEMEDEFSE